MEDNLIKYIVYLTTNLINKKIYIGVHKTTTPYKFDGYLGCGVRINDRSTYRYCHTPFQFAVNKYGPDNFTRKTLKVFDKLEDALDCERWLVDQEFISRKDTYNIQLGGGLPPVKTKTIYQYDLNGNYIKEWPSITEASIYYKCSSSCIGKAIFDRTPSLKYLWSDFKYDKLNLDKFHLNENKVPVYFYNTEGKYLGGFRSITEAANKLKTTTPKLLNVIKGKYCYGKKYYISDIKYNKFPIPNSINHKNDKLYQYDMQGNFIKEWNNYSEVCKYFGKTLSIHRAIRCGASCENYQWSWIKLPKMKELELKTKARKVGKYTKEGKLIQVFNTVREAKKDTCGAPNVLCGRRKTAGGYIWKYIKEN